jgi:TP901 family phage tail tape measure protein
MGNFSNIGIGVLLTYSVAGLNQVNSMDRALSKLWTTTADGTRVLTQMGQSMVMCATGAIALAGGLALVNGAMDNVEAWAEYEYSLAHVQGLMSYTREEMANFESQAYDTARATRYTAGETMDAYWELLSAGYSEREVLNLLEPTMQAAVIGQMELKDSADMVTSAMKAFQIPAEEAGGVVDVLTAGVRISKIHFDEYAQAFGTMGSSAAAANASLEETVALFGIMRSAGMSGSKASMMVKMMYTHLMGLSDANRELMHSLGVYTIDALTGQMRPISDIIADLFTALPEVPELTGLTDTQIEGMSDETLERILYSEERLKAFSDIFGLRAVAGMYAMRNAQLDVNGEILNGLDAYSAMVGVLQNSQGYAEDYYQTLVDTFKEKQLIIKASSNAIQTQLGDALGTTMVPILDVIIKALETVGQFLDKYPQVAAALSWMGAIGGVILVVGGAVLLIAGLASAVAALAPIIAVIAIVVGGVFQLVGMIAAGIGLVIAYWSELEPIFAAVGGWVVAHIVQPIWGMLRPVLGLLITVGTWLWDNIIAPIIGILIPIVGAIISVISVYVGSLIISLRAAWGVMETIFAFFEALFTWNWEGFGEKIAGIWDSVLVDIGNIGTFFTETISTVIKNIIPSLRGSLGLPEDRRTWFETAGLAITSPTMLLTNPGSFASGTTQVQHDGPVMVHEGEEITQRGRSNSSKPSIGQVTFNVHGVQDPEGFMNRAYAQLQRLMANDMQMTVRP